MNRSNNGVLLGLQESVARGYFNTLISRYGEPKIVSGRDELTIDLPTTNYLVDILIRQNLFDRHGLLKGQDAWLDFLHSSLDRKGRITEHGVQVLDGCFQNALPKIMDVLFSYTPEPDLMGGRYGA